MGDERFSVRIEGFASNLPPVTQLSPMQNPRRRFLQAAGVGLALPLLDCFLPRRLSAAQEAPPKRLVTICTSLGIHAPFFFPTKAGKEYEETTYLSVLKEHREHFTVLSGLSHPDQSGSNGHASEMTWLTGAKHPGLGGFRNTISLDQLAAEKIGFETRFPSLQLGTSGTSQSYTRSGVNIPANTKPSQIFAKLFLEGSKEQIAAEVQKLREGQSIMDAVRDEAKRFGQRVGPGDRQRLEEYFSSIREMEQRLVAAEEWVNKPKPEVEAKPPTDVADEKDLIGRMRLLFELIPLIVQNDSTRIITVLVQGRNDVPPVKGVSIDHHNLSHHGQDEQKIAQLKLIEEAEMQAVADLLAAMRRKEEAGKSLLDQTMLLFGTNLGNANSHDTRNLPLILAGGGFQHGQFLAGNEKNNTPLCNLYVQLLQRMGLPIESFGSSTSMSVTGLT